MNNRTDQAGVAVQQSIMFGMVSGTSTAKCAECCFELFQYKLLPDLVICFYNVNNPTLFLVTRPKILFCLGLLSTENVMLMH